MFSNTDLAGQSDFNNLINSYSKYKYGRFNMNYFQIKNDYLQKFTKFG